MTPKFAKMGCFCGKCLQLMSCQLKESTVWWSPRTEVRQKAREHQVTNNSDSVHGRVARDENREAHESMINAHESRIHNRDSSHHVGQNDRRFR